LWTNQRDVLGWIVVPEKALQRVDDAGALRIGYGDCRRLE
jgi:hypothetical protein